MPNRKASAQGPTREDMERAEREVGENLPESMVGTDDGDVRDVVRHEEDADRADEATDARH